LELGIMDFGILVFGFLNFGNLAFGFLDFRFLAFGILNSVFRPVILSTRVKKRKIVFFPQFISLGIPMS